MYFSSFCPVYCTLFDLKAETCLCEHRSVHSQFHLLFCLYLCLQISAVRLPREPSNPERLKGFGYAEFDDVDSLLRALSLNEEVRSYSLVYIFAFLFFIPGTVHTVLFYSKIPGLMLCISFIAKKMS